MPVTLQLDVAALDAGHVQQVLDEGAHASDLRAHARSTRLSSADEPSLPDRSRSAASASDSVSRRDRSDRRAQVVRERGQDRVAQPFRFDRGPRPSARRRRSARARSRSRQRRERLEQAALLRDHQQPSLRRTDASTPRAPIARHQRKEQPRAARKRVGPGACRRGLLDTTTARSPARSRRRRSARVDREGAARPVRDHGRQQHVHVGPSSAPTAMRDVRDHVVDAKRLREVARDLVQHARPFLAIGRDPSLIAQVRGRACRRPARSSASSRA